MTDETTTTDTGAEDRLGGGLMLGGTLAALFLMLHHPTSLHGPDDGHLMRDWSNGLVHGGMHDASCWKRGCQNWRMPQGGTATGVSTMRMLR